MIQKVVIIGGGAAGPKTAAKLKRENKDLKIELYTDEKNISYSACGLPYYIEDIIPNIDDLLVRTPQEFEKNGINVFLEKRAIKIDIKEQTVIFQDLISGENFSVCYDILVIATGARPFIPKIKNIEAENVFTLRNLEDGIKIKNYMKKSKTVTIIGMGFIGLELTEAFIKNGLKVNIINKNKFIMNIFDDEISEQIQEYILEKDGNRVTIYNEQIPTEFERCGGIVKRVLTSKNEKIDTDFVIISAGVIPNSELAKDAGLKIGVKNSIWVNSHLKTSYPNIYAVGDCCEKINSITKKHCWIPLGSTANKEGRCAAINIANNNCDFGGISGAAVSRYFNYTVAIAGITEKEAKKLGYEVISATVTKEDRAGYMPEAAMITLKLIADANSREIIGVQGIGTGDAEKRVATASLAILHSVKTDDFMSLDLPYSPPYSTAIDPLLNAVQILQNRFNKIEK